LLNYAVLQRLLEQWISFQQLVSSAAVVAKITQGKSSAVLPVQPICSPGSSAGLYSDSLAQALITLNPARHSNQYRIEARDDSLVTFKLPSCTVGSIFTKLSRFGAPGV
jgi:hypothetical protein